MQRQLLMLAKDISAVKNSFLVLMAFPNDEDGYLEYQENLERKNSSYFSVYCALQGIKEELEKFATKLDGLKEFMNILFQQYPQEENEC